MKEVIAKEFKVVARSENTNSFGLRQFVVVARDGEAYTIHGSYLYDKQVGDVVHQSRRGVFHGYELCSKVHNAPAEVVKQAFN